MDLNALTERGNALKSQGKLNEALRFFERAARQYPSSAVAEHNLAAVLGDLGRPQEAERHAKSAFRKGLQAPETWLVFARALVAQGKLEEASSAFSECLRISPVMLDAQFELAQLTWMRTADGLSALTLLEGALQRYPEMVELHVVKARALIFISGKQTAHDYILSCLQRWPLNTKLLTLSVETATCAADVPAILSHSEQLWQLLPESQTATILRSQALLAADQLQEAQDILTGIWNANPYNQMALALLTIIWRLTDDPNYKEFCNYDQLIRTYTIRVPSGWDSLDDFLSDLADALNKHHLFKTHPFSNSEQDGSKVSDILAYRDPAIQALEEALAPSIARNFDYLRSLGCRPPIHPTTSDWQIDGIWSVLLYSGGFHRDHIHPNGWLSSACYIDVAGAVDEDQAGWIKFGEPGVLTSQPLPHEFAVRPEPGMLVLFPSYMWHGTMPLTGTDSRLTVAFDVRADGAPKPS